MKRLTKKEKKHFDELNEKFQEVCKNEKAKGCSCPKVEITKGKVSELFALQIIKGVGAVPCEARCKWDSDRISLINNNDEKEDYMEMRKAFYKKSTEMIIKLFKNGDSDE